MLSHKQHEIQVQLLCSVLLNILTIDIPIYPVCIYQCLLFLRFDRAPECSHLFTLNSFPATTDQFVHDQLITLSNKINGRSIPQLVSAAFIYLHPQHNIFHGNIWHSFPLINWSPMTHGFFSSSKPNAISQNSVEG